MNIYEEIIIQKHSSDTWEVWYGDDILGYVEQYSDGAFGTADPHGEVWDSGKTYATFQEAADGCYIEFYGLAR